MAQNFFQMVGDNSAFTLPTKPLSGAEKAAILFSELGAAVTEKMLPLFTDKELKKLSRGFRCLDPYNPATDNRVLEAACNYGKAHGIFKPVARHYQEEFEHRKENAIRSQLGNNPEAVANILRSWLEDK